MGGIGYLGVIRGWYWVFEGDTLMVFGGDTWVVLGIWG